MQLLGRLPCLDSNVWVFVFDLPVGVNVVVSTRIDSVNVKPVHAVMITTVDHSLLRSD